MLEDVSESKFLLIVLSEEQYMKQIYEIVMSIKQTKNKVCYVCISKPYGDVVEDLKKNGIDTKAFVFIDVLSSHYEKPRPIKNCIFLDSPDLDSIKRAIDGAIAQEACSVLLFDTLSAMLIYQESFPVLRFAHSMTMGKNQENVKKVFLVLKKGNGIEKENASLISDLKMFADKTLEIC